MRLPRRFLLRIGGRGNVGGITGGARVRLAAAYPRGFVLKFPMNPVRPRPSVYFAAGFSTGGKGACSKNQGPIPAEDGASKTWLQGCIPMIPVYDYWVLGEAPMEISTAISLFE